MNKHVRDANRSDHDSVWRSQLQVREIWTLSTQHLHGLGANEVGKFIWPPPVDDQWSRWSLSYITPSNDAQPIGSLPALHNSGCPWSHAIHTPICESMLVANGDGEPTKVGSNHLDGLLGLAGNPEVVSFTSVGRFIFGAIWCLTWNNHNWKKKVQIPTRELLQTRYSHSIMAFLPGSDLWIEIKYRAKGLEFLGI